MMDVLITVLILLGIVVVIAIIWAIVWWAMFLPIRQKDELIKEREQADKELKEIQAAKSVEWDKYKNLTEEVERLRKTHFHDKSVLEKLKEEVAKLELDKEKMNTYIKKQKEEISNKK